MSPVLQIQRRMMQLGRVRMGEKGATGEPKRRDTFRFTTASEALARAVAERYGGTAKPWAGAPDEGYWEVGSEANALSIILPPVFSDADGSPTVPYSQFYELWSGGGCQRRCDGATEALTGKPCVCNPDARACQITTRVSFMLPEIPGLGVWRLDSHGWNAAVELPGTLEVLLLAAARQSFIPAELRIEHRTKKVPGEGTRRFIVPVIDLPQTRVGDVLAAASGGGPLSINAPTPAPPKPALPAAQPLPEEPGFAQEPEPEFGARPALPGAEPEPDPVEELAHRLLAVADKLGTRENLERSIRRNAKLHEAALEKHLDWLGRALAEGEKQLAERPDFAPPAGVTS